MNHRNIGPNTRVTGRVHGEPSTQRRMACTSCVFDYVLIESYLLYVPPKHFGSSEISDFACFPFRSPPTHSDLLVLLRSQHLRIQSGFCLRLRSLHYLVITTIMARMPSEIRFTLEFQPGVANSIIDSILEPLQLIALDRNVNEILYPTSVSLRHAIEPPLIDLARHWIPWHEFISTGAIYHFYVAETQIFEHLTNLAFATGNYLTLVAPDVPLALREETVLLIHTIPVMRLMELAAESATRIRDLELRLADAEHSIALIRQHLGL